ncbi:MAG: DsbA family protein [Treponema sp.]|jgi:predicted DsbA family dithiol-disulfide isomerase|nr:DsbA family protein [Treponema sp.]
MAKITVYYDYVCPYCKRGLETLLDLLPAYPGAEIEWTPVESHPRPEDFRPHTDLCVRAYYIARELGADIKAFHAALFRAAAEERQDVENPAVLEKVVEGLMDGGVFRASLDAGKFASRAGENNDAADKAGVWFLPAFRAGKIALDAKGGAGVSGEELKAFLDRAARLNGPKRGSTPPGPAFSPSGQRR